MQAYADGKLGETVIPLQGIDRIIAIDLPRPRNRDVVAGKDFAAYCEAITACFMRHGVIKY